MIFCEIFCDVTWLYLMLNEIVQCYYHVPTFIPRYTGVIIFWVFLLLSVHSNASWIIVHDVELRPKSRTSLRKSLRTSLSAYLKYKYPVVLKRSRLVHTTQNYEGFTLWCKCDFEVLWHVTPPWCDLVSCDMRHNI